MRQVVFKKEKFGDIEVLSDLQGPGEDENETEDVILHRVMSKSLPVDLEVHK